MPFNYRPQNTVQFQGISQDVLKSASRSPFEIAGQAMGDLETAIDNRAFNEQLSSASSLSEIAGLAPKNKDQASLLANKIGAFNALNAQRAQDIINEQQQFKVDAIQRQNISNAIKESQARNAALPALDIGEPLQGGYSKVFDPYADNARLRTLDERLLGIADKEFAPSTKSGSFGFTSLGDGKGIVYNKNTGAFKTVGDSSTAAKSKPKDTFTVMTEEEVKADPTLDLSKSYRKSGAGKVEEIGSSNIELEKKAKVAANERIQSADRAIKSINELKAELSDGTWFETGITGGIARNIPWVQNKAKRLEALQEHIESNLALDTLIEMKTSSPNGASGLGQVTERELQMLKTKVSNIRFDIPDKDITKNLNEIEAMYNSIINRMKNASGAKQPDSGKEQGTKRPSLKDLGF